MEDKSLLKKAFQEYNKFVERATQVAAKWTEATRGSCFKVQNVTIDLDSNLIRFEIVNKSLFGCNLPKEKAAINLDVLNEDVLPLLEEDINAANVYEVEKRLRRTKIDKLCRPNVVGYDYSYGIWAF